MEKKQEFRAGNLEHVDYPADPDGEVYLSLEQIRRHKGLADEAREAKRDGDRESYDAVMGVWREVPGFGTNTNVRGMMVRNDAVPIGSTTLQGQAPVIGGGLVTPPAIPAEHQSRPVTAREVMEAIGEDKSNPSEWIKTSGIPYTKLPNRRYVVDTRHVPKLKQPQ